MPGFVGNVAAFTPVLTVDNFTLEGDVAGDYARIRHINWGGELTVSTAYRTWWARPTTAGVGAPTLGEVEPTSPRYLTNLIEFVDTYATTPPVKPTSPTALFLTAWNAHGGLGIMVLPPGQEWEIVNGLLADSISCRNDKGVDANGSTYGIAWDE